MYIILTLRQRKELIIVLDLNKLLDKIPRVENTKLGKILLEIFKNIRHY